MFSPQKPLDPRADDSEAPVAYCPQCRQPVSMAAYCAWPYVWYCRACDKPWEYPQVIAAEDMEEE